MMNNAGVMGQQVPTTSNSGPVQAQMAAGVPQQMMTNPQLSQPMTNPMRQAQNDDLVARCLVNTQRLRENLEILLNTTRQAAMVESEDSLAASASTNATGTTNQTNTSNATSTQTNNNLKSTIDRKLAEMSQSLDQISQSLEQYDFKLYLNQNTNINQYNEIALEKQGTLLDEWSNNIKWLNKLCDFQAPLGASASIYRRTNPRHSNSVSRIRTDTPSYPLLERVINQIDPTANQTASTQQQQQMAQTNKELSINIQRGSDHLNLLEVNLCRSGIIIILYLRHFTVEHVVAKPLNEKKQFGAAFYTKGSSNYQALKLIAGHIRAAAAYFSSQLILPEAALQKVLGYISKYNTLHSTKCTGCQKHLLNGLQPTWRDFKSTEVYHEECMS